MDFILFYVIPYANEGPHRNRCDCVCCLAQSAGLLCCKKSTYLLCCISELVFNSKLKLCSLFSFNMPRVSAQLERLMGTNVVRLTDRKYMMDLRRRIHEDYNDMLAKRIENREVSKLLFFKGN